MQLPQLQNQLTRPLRTIVADCYGLIYMAGSTRTMFDSLARWVQILNDKKTVRNARCAVLACIEKLFVTQGKNISSYLPDVLGACTKQLKLYSHENVEVRKGAVTCICEGVSSCGTSGKHAHMAALKFFKIATGDKEGEVRTCVGKGVASLALACNIFESTPLELMLNVAIKGVDDKDERVRLSYARAISTMFAISILNPPTEAEKEKESKPAKQGIFKTAKKKPLYFSMASAVSYLCAKMQKASTNKFRLGIAHTIIELIQQPYTIEIVMSPDILSTILDQLLGLVRVGTTKQQSSAEYLEYSQALVSFICRRSLSKGRSERHLGLIASSVVDRLQPDKSDLLEDYQIVVLLALLAQVLSALGDASGSLGKKAMDVLDDMVVHSNHLVRLEAAACCRSLMTALPSVGSTMLDKLVERMVVDHGDLVNLAVIGNGRKKPSKSDQVRAIQLLIGLRGRSLAVAALLLAVPACPLGVPRSTTNTVLYLSTALLHQYADEDMLASASSACARAGWTLVAGVIGLGPSTIRPHLQNMMTIWKEVCRPRGPHTLNPTKTSLSELEVVATGMGALSLLLSSWPSLQVDDEEAMGECVQCVLNVVSALSPPQSSLAALASRKNVKPADVAFISLYATSLEACTRLAHAGKLNSALPALVQSTVSAFIDGTYGQTSLLDALPMLDSSDAVLQVGERSWPGINRGRDDDAYGVEDADILQEPYLLGLGRDYSGLNPLELEFALINAMAWAAPIVANGAGKGKEILGPRRSWRPSDSPPSPRALQRHVDSALGLFCSVFPILAPATRRQVLDGFVKSLKAAQVKANATTAFAARNILAAMLGASKALIAQGDNPSRSKVDEAKTANGKPNNQWQSVFKSLLTKALSIEDSIARRAAGEAIGYMALALNDGPFAKVVEKTLYAPFKSPAPGKAISEHYRAGAVFALACIRRRLGSMYRSSSVPSPFYYNQAKGTTQPVRTWSLHSWWILLNTISVDFDKYVQPTMALVNAHLLAGRITEKDREKEPYEGQTNASVLVCLGRLINSIAGGLGPDLVAFQDTDQLWACWEELKLSDFDIIQSECLSFVEQIAMFSPKDSMLLEAVPWVINCLQNGSMMVAQKAVNCIRRIVERHNDLSFEIAPYLFHEYDRRYSVMEFAPAVTSMGNFGVATPDSDGSSKAAQRSILTNSHVPALNATDGAGLVMLRAKTSPRGSNHELSMSRHAFIEDIRDALVDMVCLNHKTPPYWTSNWFKIIQSVIISSSKKRRGSNASADGEEDEDTDKPKKRKKTRQGSEPSNKKVLDLPEPDWWPLNAVRWQTKNVALECMQKLVRMASHSCFAKEHFNLEEAKKASGDYLVLHLREIIQIGCMMATSSTEGGELYQMQTLGITFVGDIIELFARTKDPGDPSAALLLQYEAQLNSALRPCFKKESYPPLTIHACRSVASMISLGISSDVAMARRAVKTLLAGADLKVKPCPPVAEKHQEHVTMCKLLARLAALGTLQVSTVDPKQLEWPSLDIEKSENDKVRVEPGMRKALSKALAQSLPDLSRYWFTALRDYVSLYARANAVMGGKNTRIPVPESSLLEYNEDAAQVTTVFEELWPTVAEAVTSLAGTNLWPLDQAYGDGEAGEKNIHDDNYDLMVGVCLRYLARSPSGGNIPLPYIIPKAKKCFTVLRWLFLPGSISITRISGKYAVEIVNVLANGLAHIEQGHGDISILGTETIAMLARNGAWLDKALKPTQRETTSDYALAHAFIEFSSRIIHHQIARSIGIPMKDISVSGKILNDSGRRKPLMKRELQKVIAALEILTGVFAAMDVECLDQYRPSIIKLLVSSQIAFVFSVGNKCHELVPHFQKLADTMVSRDSGANDHHSYKVYQLYESAVKSVVHVLEQISEGTIFDMESPSMVGMLFGTALSLCNLCRTEVRPTFTQDIMTAVNGCLHPTRSVDINHGAVVFVQNLIVSSSAVGITPSAMIGGVGPLLILLLREDSRQPDDTDLKCAIIKILVQSALQICDTPEYADLLFQVLAGFQQSGDSHDEASLVRKLCAQCALQLLKTPHARFKNAVQKLPADVQGLLQQGLKRVMA